MNFFRKDLTQRHRGAEENKKIEKLNFASPRLCVMLLAITFFSCQTAPKAPDIALEQYIPLEPGAYVYVIAEKDALPVLKPLLLHNINNIQFQIMIDQTQFAAAAVYVTPNVETGALTSRYRLAAWGSYPASRARMALASSKEWNKGRSAVSRANYWFSPQRGYAVAVTGNMALVATAAHGDPPYTPIDPFSAAPGTALPEGLAAFHQGSILSCWLNNPAPAVNKKLTEMGIPLEIPAQQIFVGLLPVDENQRYAARLQIQFDSASQARALSLMFAFARNLLPPQSELGILFANPPTLDGINLNITTAPLTVREISLLLQMFAL